MARRKFFIVAGQSNAGTAADAQSWEDKNLPIALRSPRNPVTQMPQFAEGALRDDFLLPINFDGGPQGAQYGTILTNSLWQTAQCKGRAMQALRFLTHYNPTPSYLNIGVGSTLTYPGTGSIGIGATPTIIPTTVRWQYSPIDKTITRLRTGVVHTLNKTRTVSNPAADVGVENITTSAAHTFETGDPIYETAGTTITNLTVNTQYYAIRVNSTVFKVASTYANAVAGTPITLVAGSGVTVKFHKGYPGIVTAVSVDPPMVPAPEIYENFTYTPTGGAASANTTTLKLTQEFGGLNDLGSLNDPLATSGYHGCTLHKVRNASGDALVARATCLTRFVHVGASFSLAAGSDARVVSSVDLNSETLTLGPSNPFVVGDCVTSNAAAGTLTGVTDGTPYFVVYSSGYDIRISATPGGSAVDILAFAGTVVILDAVPTGIDTSAVYYVTRQATELETTTAASWNDAGDYLTWATVAHGLVENEKIRITSGTPPAGLNLNTDYYARILNQTQIQFALTRSGTPIPFGSGGLPSPVITRQEAYFHFFFAREPGGTEVVFNGNDALNLRIIFLEQARGSLTGLQARCTVGTNVGQTKALADIHIEPPNLIITSEAWGSTPQAGDEYVIEPPSINNQSVPFEKFALFLPWSPFEGHGKGTPLVSVTVTSGFVGDVLVVATVGGVVAPGDQVRFLTNGSLPAGLIPGKRYWVVQTNLAGTIEDSGSFFFSETYGGTTIKSTSDAGSGSHSVQVLRQENKSNPFPPGFNYPNHLGPIGTYQPFDGAEILTVARQTIATGLGVRLHEYHGEVMYAVPCWANGTPIAHQEVIPGVLGGGPGYGFIDGKQQLSWSPGEDNNCFARFLLTLDATVNAFAAQGDTGECIGIFWLQGEADASYEEWAERYYTNCTRLKTAMRQAIKDRNLVSGSASKIPFIQPHIKTTPWVYSTALNAAIDKMVEQDSYHRTVDSATIDALKVRSDGVHYTGAALAVLEDPLYDQWVETQRSGPTEVQVCNMALANLGATARVTSIDPSDGSAEATLCAQYFATCRDELLEGHRWDFATRRATLVSVTHTRTDYAYCYEFRNDVDDILGIIGVQAAGAIDDNDFEEHTVELDSTGRRRIYTDAGNATLIYTARVTDSTRWSAKFVRALSWKLAAAIAGPIVKTPEAVMNAEKMAAFYAGQAAKTDARSKRRKKQSEHIPSFLQGRFTPPTV